MVWPVLRLLIAAALIVATPLATRAQGPADGWRSIQPYRAIFKLRESDALAAAAPGARVRGMVAISLTLSCVEAITATIIEIELSAPGGARLSIGQAMTEIEARDATRYRALMTYSHGSKLIERREIAATRPAPGARGTGSITVRRDLIPRTATVAIPAGALLPGEHFRRMIERMRSGETAFTHIVFLGRDGLELAESRVSVGPAAIAPDGIGSFSGQKGWNLREAQTAVGEPDAAPTGYSGFYTETGVPLAAGLFSAIFDTVGAPDSVTALPRPDCP